MVPEGRVPRPPLVHRLAPRHGVSGALLADLGAGGERGLVDGHQRAHVLRRVDVPLVPLVGVGQRRGKPGRQGAGSVAHVDRAPLAAGRLGVAGGGRTDESAVEGVDVRLGLVGGPGRVVRTHEAAPLTDVCLERGALLGVEEHARGVGEDQDVLGGEVVRGEDGSVGRLLDVGDGLGRVAGVAVEAVLGGQRVGQLAHGGTGVGHGAVHPVTAGEQQHAEDVVLVGQGSRAERGSGVLGRGTRGQCGPGGERQRNGQRGREGHRVGRGAAQAPSEWSA